MSGSRPKSSLLPSLTRTVSQALNKRPAPSSPSEVVHAPPSTPVNQESADAEKPLQSGLADLPVQTDSPENASPLPGTPGSTTSSRSRKRKARRKSEKGEAEETGLLGRFQPSLYLENAGSVARDHLASERTFLAYIRTSLLFATTGVALVQLFAVASSHADITSLKQISQFARPLGATLIVFGLLVLLTGVRRFFLIQRALTKGLFPITRFGITWIAIVLAVIIIIIFGVLVSSRS